MGQAEIYQFLKANPSKSFTYQELGGIFGIQEKTACINVNKLARTFKEIHKSPDLKYSFRRKKEWSQQAEKEVVKELTI